MKKTLVKTGFNKDDIVSFGNMFLLANGRYGYRGTLEEYTKVQMVALNVLGLYDKYEDKWRESINLPNPLFFITSFNNKEQSVLVNEPINHSIELNIYDATFKRETEFEDVVISSMRFLSSTNRDLLVHKYIVKSKKKGTIKIQFGVDLDNYDINGPHYKNKKVQYEDKTFVFRGLTNEGKVVHSYTKYIFDERVRIIKNTCFIEKTVQKGDEICIFTYSLINQNHENRIHELKYLVGLGFDELLEQHRNCFNKKWDISRVKISEEESQFELDYSIYHLLILEDTSSTKSIPARGLSGQTYKGAIFWDTETFILPFFTLTNPTFARNLIVYRINTLNGAKQKALGFGYRGAFYAWESQDDGLEQCSQFNVTDPITNEPIRTYFDEKQIHISGDVALGIYRYVYFTDDETILEDGGYEVIHECARFYISRATYRDGHYHYDDVIGPDEYHESVNDNAFTNYLAYKTIDLAIQYYDKYASVLSNNLDKQELISHRDMIYLPKVNDKGLLEQFHDYFLLDDIYPDQVKSMARNDKEYLGHLALGTKTIKQADVIALMVMMPEFGLLQYAKDNYDYYLPFTEHGSSLSSSMYSIVASKIDKTADAYQMFRKSSGIDLGTNQKMYAGGIYIGGTHPASNAGAYLSVIFGFAGLCLDGNNIKCYPHLPEQIKQIEFKFYYKKKLYRAVVNKNDYQLMEVTDHD